MRWLRWLQTFDWSSRLNGGRWLSLVAIGGAATLAWALPPRTHEFRMNYGQEPPTAAQLRLQSARAAAVTRNARQIREHWLRAVLEESRRTPPDQPVVWMPPDIAGDWQEPVRRSLAEGLRTVAPEGMEVRTGLFIVDRNQGGHPDLASVGRSFGDETYIGVDNGEPYCFVGRLRPDHDASVGWVDLRAEDPHRAIATLGACAFYAAFGVPGPSLAEWLRNGGHHYARTVFAETFPSAGVRSARGRFGSTERTGSDVLKLQSCAAGSAHTCEGIFLEPVPRYSDFRRVAEPVRRPPVAAFGSRDGRQAWLNVTVLGWLRNEFGDEAFERFWTSDLPVQAAFEAAFPVPLETWMRDWVVRAIGPVRGGAAPQAASALGSLAFVLFGALISVILMRRRSGRPA